MKKYAKVIMGKDARQQRLYETGIFVLTKPEVEYDDGWWLIPQDGYAQWFSNLVDMANYIYEYAH
jgi:hypothetical protein